MAERKTPEQKLEELEKKMEQLKAQKKAIQAKQSKLERAQRTRRLIENGALAEKYLPNGSCGVVSFGVKGGRKAAEEFMKHLKLGSIETHVADARTCCLHPASATHRQMNDEELTACGVYPDLVRYSCGLEDAEDLIADLEQAFAQI